ncbi:hypothetical protein D3C78_1560640 [compost metagenome]
MKYSEYMRVHRGFAQRSAHILVERLTRLVAAEELCLQGLHRPILMGSTLRASKHRLVQQRTLRMADQIDATAIQATLLKRGAYMLDISNTARP